MTLKRPVGAIRIRNMASQKNRLYKVEGFRKEKSEKDYLTMQECSNWEVEENI